MKKYILQRVVISLVTVWLIATCSFFLIHALPGDPFSTERIMSVETKEKMLAYYGLDRPILEQYGTFMKNLLHGDFGYSLKNPGQSVNGIIAEKFPVSAMLGIMSWLVSLPLGLLFGIIPSMEIGRAHV